jgi:hypothetical protein
MDNHCGWIQVRQPYEQINSGEQHAWKRFLHQACQGLVGPVTQFPADIPTGLIYNTEFFPSLPGL